MRSVTRGRSVGSGTGRGDGVDVRVGERAHVDGVSSDVCSGNFRRCVVAEGFVKIGHERRVFVIQHVDARGKSERFQLALIRQGDVGDVVAGLRFDREHGGGERDFVVDVDAAGKRMHKHVHLSVDALFARLGTQKVEDQLHGTVVGHRRYVGAAEQSGAAMDIDVVFRGERVDHEGAADSNVVAAHISNVAAENVIVDAAEQGHVAAGGAAHVQTALGGQRGARVDVKRVAQYPVRPGEGAAAFVLKRAVLAAFTCGCHGLAVYIGIGREIGKAHQIGDQAGELRGGHVPSRFQENDADILGVRFKASPVFDGGGFEDITADDLGSLCPCI